MGAIYIIGGMFIYMYAFDHNPPHIHVKSGGREFLIYLDDRTTEGDARPKQLKKINEFIDTHEAELYRLWEKAQHGEEITKII